MNNTTSQNAQTNHKASLAFLGWGILIGFVVGSFLTTTTILLYQRHKQRKSRSRDEEQRLSKEGVALDFLLVLVKLGNWKLEQETACWMLHRIASSLHIIEPPYARRERELRGGYICSGVSGVFEWSLHTGWTRPQNELCSPRPDPPSYDFLSQSDDLVARMSSQHLYNG